MAVLWCREEDGTGEAGFLGPAPTRGGAEAAPSLPFAVSALSAALGGPGISWPPVAVSPCLCFIDPSSLKQRCVEL